MSEIPVLIFNQNVLLNGDMSGNLTSIPHAVDTSNTCAMQATWTGTSPVGTLTVQGSNDGTNFGAVNGLATPAVSGNSGTIILNIPDLGYTWLEIVYTAASGSGTLNIQLSGKTI